MRGRRQQKLPVVELSALVWSKIPEMSKVRPRTKLVAIHPVHGYAIPPPQDVKVSRRNARERNRVKSVNNGFEILKRHIPSAAAVKKMSKVNILTQAVEYIEGLQSLLEEGPVRPATTPLVQESGQAYQAQYPAPPLTPISPNTMYFPHPHPHHPHPHQPPSTSFTPRHYESGYDSNQEPYQEEGKPGWHQYHHQQHHQHHQHQHHQPHLTPLSPPDSSVSASSPSTTYLLPGPVNTNTSLEVREDSSGEEDDILDAIAEWQQD